jgi:RNA polymerase sigma-70 factor (ECF subfamily)
MVLIRGAYDHLRRDPVPDQTMPLESIVADALPLDLDGDGARQLSRLREALEASMGALEARDRMLLKLHYLDGASLDRLAVFSGVHRATVARWLAELRRRIIAEVGTYLGARFGTRPSELRSLWRLYGAEVQVSLSRILASPAGPREEPR